MGYGIFRELLSKPRARSVLLLLLLIDAVVIAVHLATGRIVEFGLMQVRPPFLDFTADGGLGEMVGYAKWASLTVLMAALWKRSGTPVYLALAFTFLVLLADDSLRLHERLGGWISGGFGWYRMAGLRGQDIGELIVWGLLATPVVLALGIGMWRSPSLHRRRAGALFAVLAALVGVGVVADIAGVWIALRLSDGLAGRLVNFAVRVIEDGGEMVLASLAVALAVALSSSQRRSPGAGVRCRDLRR